MVLLRIKTREGERNTRTQRQCTKTTELNIATCQLHFLKTLVWKEFLVTDFFKVASGKDKASVPSPPPTKKWTKRILPKGAQQKVLCGVNQTWMLSKQAACRTSSTLSLYHSAGSFLQPPLLQALGKHNCESYSTPVASQCILIAAGHNSTVT